MNVLNKLLLTVNLLLVCGFIIMASRPAAPIIHSLSSTNATVVTAEASVNPLPNPPAHSNWESSGDWRQWINRLREAGVPIPVIAGIVQAGFDDRWLKRQGQAEASYRKGEIDMDVLSALAVQHDRERENEVRAAIGDEAFRNLNMANVLQAVPLQGVTLTASESNSVYDLEKTLERVSQDANEAKFSGRIDQAECDSRMEQAQAEHNQQLKSLLGDERYATMYPPLPVVSADAPRESYWQRDLPANVPFDSMLDMQSHWNEKRSDAEERLRKAKEQAVNCEAELQQINQVWEAEFQRVLGNTTYDAMQKENDASYKDMKRYADQWSLDATTMDHVYRTIKYYEKSVADYEREARALEAKGEEVDWDGVKKNLNDFGTQLQQSLQSSLGQELFDRLKYNNVLPFARKITTTTN